MLTGYQGFQDDTHLEIPSNKYKTLQLKTKIKDLLKGVLSHTKFDPIFEL